MRKVIFSLLIAAIGIFALTSFSLSTVHAGSMKQENIIYLYGSNSDTYQKQLELTSGEVGTLAPNYFNLDENGNLLVDVDAGFVNNAHAKGYRITPFISNHWNQALAIKAMSHYETLADSLAQAVLDNGLDGVNVDIENLTAAQKDIQTKFLQRLSDKLQPQGKTVSIAVAPARYDTTVGWVGSYDFEAIGKIVDTVFLMAYDESYPSGPAGPVAGYDWVRESVSYLVNKVPSDKIVLGVPFYGRYWAGSIKGGGMDYPILMSLIEKNNAAIQFDATSASMYSKFVDKASGTSYEIWFDNADTLLKKIALVTEFKLKGWGAWRLGQEDPLIWKKLTKPNQTSTFIDISTHWAEAPIKQMADKQFFGGYSDKTFRPENKISREEVAAVLARILKLDDKKTASFTDMNAQHWSYSAVTSVSLYGLMNGYPDKTFKPGKGITRGELAAVLARSFALKETGGKNSELTDIENHWAKYSILKLQKTGVIKGYEDGTFRPNQAVTRAEFAVLLNRILQ